MPPAQISAIELQQQLLDIDGRLTELELRGRDLEESIRNGNAFYYFCLEFLYNINNVVIKISMTLGNFNNNNSNICILKNTL